MSFDVFIKKLLVCKERLDVQDALDTTEMLFAFPFLIKDHFPKDDVFYGSDVDRTMRGIFREAILPSPCKGGVAVSGIEVGLESRRDVNEIEMTSAVAGNFGSDQICWGAVVFRICKAGEKRRDFFDSDKKGNVNIQCEARFTVVHCPNGAGYEISNAGGVQRKHKKFY